MWYDIYEDWGLIEASFLKEYGIRLRQEVSQLSWGEFCSLLSAIGEDTPLGRIVSIRCEDDREHLKYFTPKQREIRTKL
ncbi:MAG: Gp15 family bacteriophage protein [Oscillospiraceae bacterium]